MVNSNEDVVEIVAEALREDGHTVVTGHLHEWKRDPARIAAFFRAHRPEVVVYDIAVPYEQDWDFFRHVVRPHPDTRDVRFVLTTTNKRAVQELVGDVDIIEVLAKPYNLEQIAKAVRYGSSSSGTAGRPAS